MSLLVAAPVAAQIAFDAASTSTFQTSVSSVTLSHTTSGTDRAIVACVGVRDSGNLDAIVSSVTYAGTNLTLSGTKVQNDTLTQLWYLAPATAGANNLVVTFSRTIENTYVGAMSFKGVDQVSPQEASSGANGSGTTMTGTVTTVTDQAFAVDCLSVRSPAGGTYTFDSGHSAQINTSTSNFLSLHGSYEGPVSPAGAVTMGGTYSLLKGFALRMAALKPSPCGLVYDGVLRVPASYPRSLPGDGQSYTDPDFGCTTTQIIDIDNECQSIGGIYYNTPNWWNADKSKIVMRCKPSGQGSSSWAIFDSSGSLLRSLVGSGICTTCDPRWDRSNGDIFYWYGSKKLKKYSYSSNSSTDIKDFSSQCSTGTIYPGGKGDWDLDVNSDVFTVICSNNSGNSTLFTYTISTDTISSALSFAGDEGKIDYAQVSNSGEEVIVRWRTNSECTVSVNQCFRVYDASDMSFSIQLTNWAGHSAPATDTSDSNADVLIATNGSDTTPISGCNPGIIKIRLSDAQETCLVGQSYGLTDGSGSQVSINNHGGSHDWILLTQVDGRKASTIIIGSNSITRSSGTVTVTQNQSYAVNQTVNIAGTSGCSTSPNGIFKIVSRNATSFTYTQSGTDETCGGGTSRISISTAARYDWLTPDWTNRWTAGCPNALIAFKIDGSQVRCLIYHNDFPKLMDGSTEYGNNVFASFSRDGKTILYNANFYTSPWGTSRVHVFKMTFRQ